MGNTNSFQVPIHFKEEKTEIKRQMKNGSVRQSKSSNGNYMVESFLLRAHDEHSLCFVSPMVPIYKMKDLRFHIPSGFDLEETISGMSFGC